MSTHKIREAALWDAVNFAWSIHSGQTRKDGITPYIIHPLAVMIDVMKQTKDLNTWMSAVCHDVIEDSPDPDFVYEQLEEGFGVGVAGIVFILTRKKDEKYSEYIQRIIKSGDRNAMLIKLADLRHNLSTMDSIEDKDIRAGKLTQYSAAYNILQHHHMKKDK
jgi:(p)ppGpp synthase/HD superfamily hydrolase